MFTSWKIGRVAGIDLYLHPTFLLFLAFGALQGGVALLVLLSAVFGCVVLHELGHALTARLFGIATEDITLYPIGGVARLRRMPRKPGVEILISLAGPLVNLAIAGVASALLVLAGPASWASDAAPGESLLASLMMINLILAGFNLIPAFPMDGGRILRAGLTGWLGRLRATEVAAGLGKLLAVAFGAWSLVHSQWIQAGLAAFIYFAASSELIQAQFDQRRRQSDHDGLGSAPPGYHWVNTSRGVWQLAPIWATVTDRTPPPWR